MTTTKRTTRNAKQPVPRPIPFTNPDGEEFYRLPTTNGPDWYCPKPLHDLLVRYRIPLPARWNSDGKGNDYLRVTCGEPGRRRRKKVPKNRTLLRLVAQCMAREAGLFLPNDMEVHFLTGNHADFGFKNWEIRSRWDNKKFVDAIANRHAEVNWTETK
jgi:hypothetical protein